MMGGRCIMMCAGNYHPMEIDVQPGDWVVAVDGGLQFLEKAGIEPDFLMGDFDSLEPMYMETVEKYRVMGADHFLQLPVVKDDTDTVMAARIGIERGFREFLIYGGLGRRLDHTMANIQTLVWILRQGGQGWLLDRETSVTVIGEGTFRIPQDFEGTVSLFALDRELRGVTIRGMKYDVQDAVITNDYPVGCSNETLQGDGALPEAPGRGDLPGPQTGDGRPDASITIGEGTALLIMTEKLINRH